MVFLSYIAFSDLTNNHQHYKCLRISSLQWQGHIRGQSPPVYIKSSFAFFEKQQSTTECTLGHNSFTLNLGKIYQSHFFSFLKSVAGFHV